MQRPGITPDIIERAATSLAGRCSSLDTAGRVTLAEAIAKAYQHPMSGYDLVQAMDDQGLLDADILNVIDLDELEGMQSIVKEEHAKVCLKWVKDNDIQPPFPNGRHIIDRATNLAGEIVGVADDHAPACYLVKPEGPCETGAEPLYRVIRFEDATLAESKDRGCA